MAVRFSSCLLLLLLVGSSLGVDLHLRKFYDDSAPRSYRDYKLIRITPRNDENIKYLRDLSGVQSPYELDFWQEPSHVGALVDVTVSPEDAEIFIRDLESKQLDYIVAINDLEQAIRNEKSPEMPSLYQLNEGFQLDKYNTWPVIEDYLYELQRQHPELVSLAEIGRTHENRSLIVVKLSGKHKIGDKKVSMWIDAGIHAREWIAPATALNIIDRLINMYHSDATVQKLMDGIDWYILPVMNPDGYHHTHTKNRMWRKNRRPAVCRSNHFQTLCCAGVDLNRNFDWFWAATGSSSDSCQETYHGPAAFSEPESRAVKEFLEKNPVKGFISFHSYSQLWLIPYGHRKRAYPQDYTTALRPLALKATRALHELYGTKYAVGTGADLMYEASGASHDYAKGTLHIPYAYLVELRPKNTLFGNGFLLPENEILGTAEETFEAVKVVADEIIAQFSQPIVRPTGRPTRFPSVYRTISTLVPFHKAHSSTDSPTTPPTTTSSTATTTTSTPTTTTTSTSTSTTTTTPSTTTTTSTTETPSTATTTEAPTTTSTEKVPTEETTQTVTNRVVRCKDYGSYCRWWKIHNLCHNERVLKLCALSCLPECQI
uniref:Zinc carboxypeptidase A 1 n=1 Tax=Steinernema glaseri TaxID=37863 RepID=A0A1I8AGL9_9BILA